MGKVTYFCGRCGREHKSTTEIGRQHAMSELNAVRVLPSDVKLLRLPRRVRRFALVR